MIQHLSFKHGWFYHYRVHKQKTEERCSPELQRYLHRMLVKGECPQAPFDEGPRSSALRFPIRAEITEVEHPVTVLAAAGLASGRYQTAHSNVQVFMLEHDTHSVAVEVPIWLTASERARYGGAFSEQIDETGPLSGHIDVLRVEDDGRIWVWDFKPNAHREKYAATQTYAYARMLSARTKIPLKHFACGWFDENKAYVFDPAATERRLRKK